jgi:hypothetical protein
MSSPKPRSDPHFRVVELGPIAARTLGGASRGRLVAIFERSAYLDFDGSLVCVGSPAIGAGPLDALVESAQAMQRLRASLDVHDDVVRNGTSLRVGTALLDFASARRWRPASLALPLDRARLVRGIAHVRACSAGRLPTEGLAFLVARSNASHALAQPGRAAACALAQWLDEADDSTLAPLAALIGLGPGLTPSGDDFLGGALIALHAYGRVAQANHLAAWLLRRMEDATHPISVAHFRAACEGQGSDALHACLRDIAGARDPQASLARIAAIGHTSGWDALAGAITVAVALAFAVDARATCGTDVGQRARSTRSASSAACAFEGATTMPAASSVRTCRE